MFFTFIIPNIRFDSHPLNLVCRNAIILYLEPSTLWDGNSLFPNNKPISIDDNNQLDRTATENKRRRTINGISVLWILGKYHERMETMSLVEIPIVATSPSSWATCHSVCNKTNVHTYTIARNYNLNSMYVTNIQCPIPSTFSGTNWSLTGYNTQPFWMQTHDPALL